MRWVQDVGGAREEGEVAREELGAAHAQAAHMEAERRSKEVELQAIKVRGCG